MSARQMVVFGVGGERYALPLEQVREVLAAQPLRPVPSSGRSVAGVIVWRGRIVPVLDLAACLGVHCPHDADRPAERILIVRWPHQEVGWLVESVEEVITIAQDAVQPAPRDGLGMMEPGVVQGMVPLQGRILLLLDSLALGAVLAGDSAITGARS
ncbi:MAG: chemotaxis protein CheW [Candidatus Omnitrophica bacterium]|nr:chemotaxis protein CheW [Candidatus Omnitrophota bacterium]